MSNPKGPCSDDNHPRAGANGIHPRFLSTQLLNRMCRPTSPHPRLHVPWTFRVGLRLPLLAILLLVLIIPGFSFRLSESQTIQGMPVHTAQDHSQECCCKARGKACRCGCCSSRHPKGMQFGCQCHQQSITISWEPVDRSTTRGLSYLRDLCSLGWMNDQSRSPIEVVVLPSVPPPKP